LKGEKQMLTPIIFSSIFVLAVVILCLTKPNAGRILLGIFFLVMALGVNGSFTFSNPHAYIDYASEAMIPFYGELAVTVVKLNPTLFGLLLMVFEIAMGLLMLHKHGSVKIGLIGTMVFLIGISPCSLLQLPWLGLLIGQVYLMTKEFDATFLEIVRSALQKRRSQKTYIK
jgi:hypothetical protein